MKKFTAWITVLSLFCAIPVTAAGSKETWYYSDASEAKAEWFDVYEDFEDYASGYTPGAEGKWLKNTKANTYVTVDEDSEGKFLKIGAKADVGSADAFINPNAVGMSGTFFISFDLKAEKIENGDLFLSLRNADPNTTNSYDMFQLKKDGEIVYFGSNTDKNGNSAKITSHLLPNEKKTIGLLCNTIEKTAEIYEDGVKIGKIINCDTVQSPDKTPNFENFYTRFYMSADGECAVCLDNIRILRMQETESGLLSNRILVSDDSLEGTQPSQISDTIINNTGRSITANAFTALYQKSILTSLEAKKYDLNQNRAVTLTNSTSIIGKNVAEDVRLFLFEENTLLPLTYSCSADAIYYEDKMISSDTAMEMLCDANMKNVHPRLMITNESLEKIKSDAELQTERADLIALADEEVKKGTVSIEYNITDGRLLAVSRRVKERVMLLAFAYNLTGNTKYSDAAWKVMEKACEFPDWNTQHLLDTAEMCCGIAFGYDWLYSTLSDEQRNLIETAIREKALSYAYSCYTNGTGGWMSDTSNRNIVENGSFIIGALALLDKSEYSEQCSRIIQNAVYYTRFINETLGLDGAWNEGVGYLDYALGYLAETYASMETALNSNFDLLNIKGVSGINPFLMYASGAAGRNNFYDDSETEICFPAKTLYLAKTLNKPSEAAYFQKTKEKLRKTTDIGELIWHFDADKSGEETLPLDGYFRGIEFVAMRDRWENSQSYLSFHGGKTDGGEGHSHIDAGSFVLDLDGVRWAEDLGTDNITYSYGSGKRKSVYRVRTEGHNTLVINPENQTLKETADGGQSADTNAKVTEFSSLNGGTTATLDLSSAYPDSCIEATRKFSLIENRTVAEIEDKVTLKENSEIYWFMHTKTPDKITDNADGSVTLEREGKKVNISVSYFAENESGTLSMSVEKAEKLASSPPTAQTDSLSEAKEEDNGAYRKLQIKITNAPKGVNCITVRIKSEQ